MLGVVSGPQPAQQLAAVRAEGSDAPRDQPEEAHLKCEESRQATAKNCGLRVERLTKSSCGVGSNHTRPKPPAPRAARPPPSPHRRSRLPAAPGRPRPRRLRVGVPALGLPQPRLLRLPPWPGPPLLRGMRPPPKPPPSTLPPSRRCSRPTLRQGGRAPLLSGSLRTTPWTWHRKPTRMRRLCSRQRQRWRRLAASSASAAACRADAPLRRHLAVVACSAS